MRDLAFIVGAALCMLLADGGEPITAMLLFLVLMTLTETTT